ncbi:DUF4352 domain-containing protein [Streptomyces sp. NPDC055254]
MSTPPNPHSTPTEPAGTPVPEAVSIPAPAQPPSFDKAPAPAPTSSPAPEDAAPASAPAPAPVPSPSPAPGDAAPASAPAPAPAPFAASAPAPSPFAAPTPENPARSPFAPPAPGAQAPQAPAYGAVPGGPGAPGGPGGPGNPWAQPGPGYGGPGYPGYPPAAQPNNGLAIAALVLGIVAILVGITPFFFWAGALLGLTGLGLGIGGLVRARKGAPRKQMAVAGIVLGALSLGASAGGFFITAAFVKEVDKEIDKQIDASDIYPSYTPPGSKSSPKASPSDIPGKTSALEWGKPFVYDDGVELVVAGASPQSIGKNAYPTERVGRGVKVTVTIANKSSAAIDVSSALPNARDDKGNEVEMVFDGNLPKLFKGSVLPGQSATASFLFDVPEDSKGLHFEMSPGSLADYDDAIWNGPIG